MQQTDKYKLNKPGIDDPLAIAPLNENADTLDAALNGLNQRILTLENCRIVVGRYMGTGEYVQQLINLGERPVAVLACYCAAGAIGLTVGDLAYSSADGHALKLDNEGFRVMRQLNRSTSEGYTYVAFLGGWGKNDPVSKQP